jgi:Na+/H+-translocating membrane pyrophosphatase
MFVLIALFLSSILGSIIISATSFYTFSNARKIYSPVKSVASGVALGVIAGISIGLTQL